MAKVLASTLSTEQLSECISKVEAEMEALDTTRRCLENIRAQKRNPEIDFGVADIYIEF